jgi:hypothetical protein
LNVSCPMVFTLTLPGSSRIAANTSTPVTSAAPNSVPASSGTGILLTAGVGRPCDQREHPGGSLSGDPAGDPRGQRLLSLPQRGADDPPDPVPGRRLDPLALQVRQQLLMDPAWRSFSHTFAASHSAALSASATEHSRNPKYRRTSAR